MINKIDKNAIRRRKHIVTHPNGIHGVHVIHLGLRNQQERGNLSLDIEKCMDFDASLC